MSAMNPAATGADGAWSEYLQAIDAARTLALGWRWAQTPSVTPQQRRRQLDERRRQVGRRFNV